MWAHPMCSRNTRGSVFGWAIHLEIDLFQNFTRRKSYSTTKNRSKYVTEAGNNWRRRSSFVTDIIEDEVWRNNGPDLVIFCYRTWFWPVFEPFRSDIAPCAARLTKAVELFSWKLIGPHVGSSDLFEKHTRKCFCMCRPPRNRGPSEFLLKTVRFHDQEYQ